MFTKKNCFLGLLDPIAKYLEYFVQFSVLTFQGFILCLYKTAVDAAYLDIYILFCFHFLLFAFTQTAAMVEPPATCL